MRTRCPECSTVFRVTPEQLRLKAGRVRCGQCHGVFNAFETLIEDSPPASAPAVPAASTASAPVPPFSSAEFEPPAPAAGDIPLPPPLPEAAPDLATEPPPPPQVLPAEVQASPAPPPSAPTGERQEPSLMDFPAADEIPAAPTSVPSAREVMDALEAPAADEISPAPTPERPLESAPPEPKPPESVEESTEAARAAGLVAARELSDTPAFNRWAAGTLAGDTGNFQLDDHPPSRLPFLLAALALSVLLLGQAAFQWRTALVQRLPELATLYQAAGIDVPLPRISDLVAIESSDLQFDKSRGLLVLQATLHNRAAFAQDWPALELTLTDTQDAVITRRVLNAADYLPSGTDLSRFGARAELAIRLWLEAREIGAAGYRLYIFYP